MSDVEITCPNCKRVLEVPEELMGEETDCPACKHNLRLSLPIPRKSSIPSVPKKIFLKKRTSRPENCPVHIAERTLATADLPTKAEGQKKKAANSGCGLVLFIVLVAIIYGFSQCGRSHSPETSSQPKTTEELKKERIECGFSTWDGSHKALTKLIKEKMNDPGSYQHVQTFYAEIGGNLRVTTTFRGKNAFGALVLNRVIAEADLDGNVIRILYEGQ